MTFIMEADTLVYPWTMMVILQHAAIAHSTVVGPLRLGLAAFGTLGCRHRDQVQVRRPMNAIAQRSTVCALFLCPNEAVTHALRRVACKAWGYSTDEVIVGEQVDDDQHAREY